MPSNSSDFKFFKFWFNSLMSIFLYVCISYEIWLSLVHSLFESLPIVYLYYPLVKIRGTEKSCLWWQVENQLPEKIERLVRCEASAYQKLLMKRVGENLGSLGMSKVFLVCIHSFGFGWSFVVKLSNQIHAFFWGSWPFVDFGKCSACSFFLLKFLLIIICS